MSTRVACPACGGSRLRDRFLVRDQGEREDFRPSSEDYGRPPGHVVRCVDCGHGFALDVQDEDVRVVYEGVEDETTLREAPGEVATARRDLERIERVVSPGRVLDIGCWTGSFLTAARERGWDGQGLEPSRWAVEHARGRGLDVIQGTFPDPRLEAGSFRMIAVRDVIEHLPDPAAAVAAAATLLERSGVLFLVLPDAGSAVARVLGRRWWSVMPMHLHYFTRGSLTSMLERGGFEVSSMRTHPKIFSAEYYLERLAAFAPPLRKPLLRGTRGGRLRRRLVAPDFRDRMAVIARIGQTVTARPDGDATLDGRIERD